AGPRCSPVLGGSGPAGVYEPCWMGSKVPGAVVTDPPTAKLPCSWIISGSDLLFRVSCAFAEVKRNAAISGSAMIDFRRFLLMKFPHCPSRRVTPGCSFHDPVFA